MRKLLSAGSVVLASIALSPHPSTTADVPRSLLASRHDRGRIDTSLRISIPPQLVTNVDERLDQLKRQLIRRKFDKLAVDREVKKERASLEAITRPGSQRLEVSFLWKPNNHRLIQKFLDSKPRIQRDVFQLGDYQCIINRGQQSVQVEKKSNLRAGTLMTAQVMLWGIPLGEMLDRSDLEVRQVKGKTVLRGAMSDSFVKSYFAVVAKPLDVEASFGSSSNAVPDYIVVRDGSRILQTAVASGFRSSPHGVFPRRVSIVNHNAGMIRYDYTIHNVSVDKAIADSLFLPVVAERSAVFDVRFPAGTLYWLDAQEPVPAQEVVDKRLRARRGADGHGVRHTHWKKWFALAFIWIGVGSLIRHYLRKSGRSTGQHGARNA